MEIELGLLPKMIAGGWLLAYTLTQLIEAPIYLSRLTGLAEGEPLVRRLTSALLPSGLTHPLLWWGFTPLCAELGWPYEVYFLVGELGVIGAEALVLWALKARAPLRASLIANGSSVGVAALLGYWS
jgi:hypothetical protein